MWARTPSTRLDVVVGVGALVEPPPRGELVDAVEVDLVDRQHPGGRTSRPEPGERLLQRLHVVQRDHRARGVEARGRLVELVQGDGPDVVHLGGRVDRDDVVAGGRQRDGQLAVAGADLEHAAGRRRQRGANKRDDVGGEHRTFAQTLGNPPMRRRRAAMEDRPMLKTADAVPDSIGRLVVGPSDPGWEQARRPWNFAHDQNPAFVAFPESAEDVVAIVEHARRNGLRVAPQGTGHNAGPLADLHDTILLSTSRMKGVDIDAEGRRARVSAGTLWLEVTEPASELGLAPLAGSSIDVGVVGYCLGGGVSWLGRKHGLAAQQRAGDRGRDRRRAPAPRRPRQRPRPVLGAARRRRQLRRGDGDGDRPVSAARALRGRHVVAVGALVRGHARVAGVGEQPLADPEAPSSE